MAPWEAEAVRCDFKWEEKKKIEMFSMSLSIWGGWLWKFTGTKAWERGNWELETVINKGVVCKDEMVRVGNKCH